MGDYANSEWYLEASKAFIEKYGDIPPPWVYAPDLHPYSIGWRMGGGESHIMVLSEWLDHQKMDFNQRLQYLKKYPAPPRWYEWIVDFLWDIYISEMEPSEKAEHFKKLEELGFENTADFEKDMNRKDLN